LLERHLTLSDRQHVPYDLLVLQQVDVPNLPCEYSRLRIVSDMQEKFDFLSNNTGITQGQIIPSNKKSTALINTSLKMLVVVQYLPQGEVAENPDHS